MKNKQAKIKVVALAVVFALLVIAGVTAQTLQERAAMPRVVRPVTNDGPVDINTSITFTATCSGNISQIVICRDNVICNTQTDLQDILCASAYTNTSKKSCMYTTTKFDEGTHSTDIATCCNRDGLCDVTTATVESWTVNQPAEKKAMVVNEGDVEIPSVINELANTTEIILENQPIHKLTFENLNGAPIKISTAARGIVEPTDIRFDRIFAIDVENVEFTTATAFTTATSAEVYRCDFWDFQLGICLGSWNFMQRVTPSATYTITLDRGSFSFAEGTNTSLPAPQPPAQEELPNITMRQPKIIGPVQNTGPVNAGEGITFNSSCIGKNTKLVLCRENSICNEQTSSDVLLCEDAFSSNDKKECNYSTSSFDTGIHTTTVATCCDDADSCDPSTIIVDPWTVVDVEVNVTQPPLPTNESNITLATSKSKQLYINKNKITYRDETPKQHKLKRLRETDGKKEKGKNWERICEGTICKHTLYGFDKYYETADGALDFVENALTSQGCLPTDEVCVLDKRKTIGFKQKASDADTLTFLAGSHVLALEPLQLRHVVNDTQIIISSANPVTGEGLDNRYTYDHIFGENISLRFTYTGSKIKEEVIFQDNAFLRFHNLANATGFLFIDYLVKTPLKLHSIGTNPETLTSGEQVALSAGLELRDNLDTPLFTLPPPFAYTLNDLQNLTYVLTRINDTFIVSIKMPLAFLQTAAYPIIIDPTITFGDAENIFDGFVEEFPKFPEYIRTSTATSSRIGDRRNVANCQSTSADVCHNRATIEWDISSLPGNANIFDVNLTIRFIGDPGGPDNTFFFYHMDGNSSIYPNTIGPGAGNNHFFLDMGNGSNYVNVTYATIGSKDINLSQSTTFLTDIHTILQSGLNSWSFGIKSNETNNTGAANWIIAAEEHSTAGFRPKVTFIYNFPVPTIILNAPNNGATFIDFINITLNATVEDNEPTLQEVVFYGDNQSVPRDEAIIAIFTNVSNGTELNYNWTAPVLLSDSDTVLHLHLDNRSEFGENDTFIADFSDASNNGTLVGTASGIANVNFNASAGKLGGTFDFNPSSSGQNRNITFGDQDELIGLNYTYLFWVKPTNTSVNGTILTKYAPGSVTGFSVELVESGKLLVRGDTDIITVDGLFDEEVYTHIGITLNASNDLAIYKDGVLNASQTITDITDNNVPFEIGVETNFLTDSFQGNIDEVLIADRVYSADDILDAYRLKNGTYYWYVNATDASGKNESGTNMSAIRSLTLNVTLPPPAANNAPVVEAIIDTSANSPTLPDQIVTEDSITNFEVSFLASDQDGREELDNATANLTVIRNLGPGGAHNESFNTSCAFSDDVDASTIRYNCTIEIYYWYEATNWNITAGIQDINNAPSTNTSNFSISSTTAIVISPVSITFPTLTIGAENITTNQATTVNNTANAQFLGTATSSVNITGTSLVGATTPAQYIDPGNFTVDIDTGGSPPAECTAATALVNATTTRIVNSVLLAGNRSAGFGNETLYNCLTIVPSGLSPQDYTTNSSAAWTVSV